MKILSHRGFWKEKSEHNTSIAFARSFDLGIGTETDVRDHKGEVVIAHDMPTDASLTFSELLHIMDGRNLMLALNIKADGLSPSLKKILTQFHHTNYFVFDMSVPELVKHIQNDMVVFTGLSDIQPSPVLRDKCRGIWLDCFQSDWYGPELIDELLKQGKHVCAVSSELHQRPTDLQWGILKAVRNIASPHFMLCTDKPLDAHDFFQVSL